LDSLSFTAELINTLAWPLTVLVIIVLLRKPIAGLIPLLQHIKYKDFELEFGRQIREVRAEANEELPPPKKPEAAIAQAPDPLFELSRISPRAAVLEAWKQVETAALDAAQRNDVPLKYRDAASPVRVIRVLENADVVDPAVMAIFHDLRALRNQAAHAPEFALSTEAVLEYVELAKRLIDYLRTAERDADS
jgi:uncharacterized protein YutE (UPF0331/DUF86 family)